MRMLVIVVVGAIAWLAVAQRSGGAPSAEATAYAGSARCAECHPVQASSQGQTGHARSLHRAAQHPLANAFARDTEYRRDPGFRFRFRRAGDQLRITGYDAKNEMDIPVEWAFGAGDQAVTLVTRIDQDWYLEHYLTYYRALDRMAPTAGHGPLRPKTLPEAMGVPYKTSHPQTGILGCFECHSTGPVALDPESGLQPLEPGVQCESCHGPGRDHAAAAGREQLAEARQRINNPQRLSATALNEFCGRCHRPPGAKGDTIDWNYSWNVRHQPVYLSQSKCFTQSEGQLSCFTCHQPHQPLQKAAPAYNERCRACHQPGGQTPALSCQTSARSNCINCHMPRVSPQPALRFTNHWIGVYGEGSQLKPRPRP